MEIENVQGVRTYLIGEYGEGCFERNKSWVRQHLQTAEMAAQEKSAAVVSTVAGDILTL